MLPDITSIETFLFAHVFIVDYINDWDIDNNVMEVMLEEEALSEADTELSFDGTWLVPQ
jgi:hypothetical protein